MELTQQQAQRQLEREQFIQENQSEWILRGSELKQKREELGISLSALARKMGTSASRIKNFEYGMPVMMADHLEKSYMNALELLEWEIGMTKENDFAEDATIDHVRIVHDGGDLYILNFVTKSGQKIHVEDIVELKWAHMVGKNKYAKHFNVPLILEMSNGEEVALSKEWQFA